MDWLARSASRKWGQDTFANPSKYRHTYFVLVGLIQSLGAFLPTLTHTHWVGDCLLIKCSYLFYMVEHPYYALLRISACGRAPPDRISTYNRSRAGNMLHRYGSVSSTQPQLLTLFGGGGNHIIPPVLPPVSIVCFVV